ncbi:MAG: hypothetical protein PQJ59_05090 [Spirochaetales bacterium]|nr:hypothetical protein [Spirochaetales bacterium]
MKIIFIRNGESETNIHNLFFCISHGGVLGTALPNVTTIKNTDGLKHYELQNTETVEVTYTKKEGYTCSSWGAF